jgi:hypothetical protein
MQGSAQAARNDLSFRSPCLSHCRPVQADDGRPGYRRFGSEAEVQTRTAQEKELDGGIPITEGIVTPEPLQ